VQTAKDQSLQVTLTAVSSHAQRLAGHLGEALESNAAALAGAEKISANDQQTLGFDIRVWLTGMRAQILATLGQHAEARAIAERQLGELDPQEDALHTIQAHATLAEIAWATGDARRLAEHAAYMKDVSERAGTPYLVVYARAYRALALALEGRYDDGAQLLEETIRYARQRRVGLENEPRMLADLAGIHLLAGANARAAQAAREALDVAHARGHRVWKKAAEDLLARLETMRADNRKEMPAA
jgi:adenylate cyclase